MVAFHRQFIRSEGQDNARSAGVLHALIFRASDLECDGLAADDPRSADRTGDTLGKRVADESQGAQLCHEAAVGAESDRLFHVAHCAHPIAHDSCGVTSRNFRTEQINGRCWR